eukprot:CAMPEP_0175117394 /NCGR_PEP_ID=MMETSP0086_2-20121207/18864_1 /TAXON_ID=136419 /ORGANISM="Unknown Unknown, Strain D1" /LENGTH=43 /DNA_ID= /DNA_START= /DNA_END= /DNA_ORIENTATION=
MTSKTTVAQHSSVLYLRKDKSDTISDHKYFSFSVAAFMGTFWS